jgi:hypothetical protein
MNTRSAFRLLLFSVIILGLILSVLFLSTGSDIEIRMSCVLIGFLVFITVASVSKKEILRIIFSVISLLLLVVLLPVVMLMDIFYF